MNFSDNFDRANSTVLGNGWVEVAGDLSITNLHLENAAVAGDHMAAQPTLLGSTQTVSADFTSAGNNAAPSFGVVLRCQDCNTAGVPPSNYYRIYRATGGSSLLKISKVVGGVETVLKTTSISNPAANVQFHLQGSASGTTLTISVGAVQTSVTDGTFASGAVGLVIRSGGGLTPIHQADNFQTTVSASATSVQISLTTPAGTASSSADLTVTRSLAVAGPSAEILGSRGEASETTSQGHRVVEEAEAPASPSEGVSSQRDLEVGPGMELTRVAESQDRLPVERIASLGFAMGGAKDPATGFSLCSVRLLGSELTASGDFGGSERTATSAGLGSYVVPSTAGSATSVAIEPKAVSAVGRRYSFYSPEMNLLAETEIKTSGTPAILYEYIWFNGHPVAQVDPGPTTHWTFTDHLGTPVIQTDSSGAVYWRAEYEPFGKVFSLRTANQHQPLRLPGQEAEELNTSTDGNGATERSYNIFRWYRPAWGRYTQLDPIGFFEAGIFGRSYDRLQAYQYASANPLAFVDRTGELSTSFSGPNYYAFSYQHDPGRCQGHAACTARSYRVDCDCVKDGTCWRPSISLSLSINISYAYDYPDQRATPQMLIEHERRHAALAKENFDVLIWIARGKETQRYKFKVLCDFDCWFFKNVTARYIVGDPIGKFLSDFNPFAP